MDKNLIIEKAREFIDTPYEHQGRLKGIGIDCCGLIILGARRYFSFYNWQNPPALWDSWE